MERLSSFFDHVTDLYLQYQDIPTFQLIFGFVFGACVVASIVLIISAYKTETRIRRIMTELESDVSNDDIR